MAKDQHLVNLNQKAFVRLRSWMAPVTSQVLHRGDLPALCRKLVTSQVPSRKHWVWSLLQDRLGAESGLWSGISGCKESAARWEKCMMYMTCMPHVVASHQSAAFSDESMPTSFNLQTYAR